MIWLLLQTTIAFLFGTIIFDVIHYLMHQAMKSSWPSLKKIGSWHSVHHRFFPSDLKIKTTWAKKNLSQHVLFEYLIEVIGIMIAGLFLPVTAVILAILFASIVSFGVWRCRGEDLHHRSLNFLPAYRGTFFVTAPYHALHHVYPNHFFSGYIKVFDCIFGTALPLAGKRIVMTGANGALGKHMKQMLEKAGASVKGLKYGLDYDYQNYQQLKTTLHAADILFLCHGSKQIDTQQANCDSFVNLIELFKTRPKKPLVRLEIWAVGSEIECHPCFGIKKLWPYAASKRNYAKKARRYFHDPEIQYRHLVHSAFTSPMGPGLMSARFAATVSLFLLKRGFRYVPVSYTGFGFLNYFRFCLDRP